MFKETIRNPASNPWVVWIALATLIVVAFHYLFFINQIKEDTMCYQQLLREQYDNQNRLTKEFYEVTVVNPSQDPAAIDNVFKSHFDRIDALDKKFVCGQN